jgi:putative membrane protein
VLVRAALSGLHVLALALALASVFARGRRLRDLRRDSSDSRARARLLLADNVWGISALLFLTTGLARAFGRLEKTPDFYLRNGFFWVKMALFALVLLLEILPMVTFLRWRIAAARKTPPADGGGPGLSTLIALNDAETALVCVIPFVAALMARGAWLF